MCSRVQKTCHVFDFIRGRATHRNELNLMVNIRFNHAVINQKGKAFTKETFYHENMKNIH